MESVDWSIVIVLNFGFNSFPIPNFWIAFNVSKSLFIANFKIFSLFFNLSTSFFKFFISFSCNLFCFSNDDFSSFNNFIDFFNSLISFNLDCLSISKFFKFWFKSLILISNLLIFFNCSLESFSNLQLYFSCSFILIFCISISFFKIKISFSKLLIFELFLSILLKFSNSWFIIYFFVFGKYSLIILEHIHLFLLLIWTYK